MGGPPPAYQGEEPWPEWLAATAEVLAARNGIERYGLDGWLKLEGLRHGDLHPHFVPALQFLDGELARLEQEDRVREAADARARAASERR